MKIVHYYANGCVDWLISGQQSDNPWREAISILSGKYERFTFVYPVDQVLIGIILFLMKAIFASEKTIAYPISKLTFHNDGGCFKCLLSTRISFRHDNTENFLKA